MGRENIIGKMVSIMKVNLKMDSEMDSENGLFLQKLIMKGSSKVISNMVRARNLWIMEINTKVNILKELNLMVFLFKVQQVKK